MDHYLIIRTSIYHERVYKLKTTFFFTTSLTKKKYKYAYFSNTLFTMFC